MLSCVQWVVSGPRAKGCLSGRGVFGASSAGGTFGPPPASVAYAAFDRSVKGREEEGGTLLEPNQEPKSTESRESTESPESRESRE